MLRKFLALVVLLASAASARADLTIDDFLSSPQSVSIATGTGSDSSSTAAPGVLGGTRTLNLEVTSNLLDQSATASIIEAGGAGYFALSAGALVETTGSIVYDAGGAGLGGLNLTLFGSAFALEVFSTDTPGLTLGISAADTGGNSLSVSFVDVVSGVLLFNFADFVAGGLDLASLDSVSIVYSTATNVDFVLDFLGVVDETPAVPEPTSAALLGLGVLGFLAARRRFARS